MGQSIYTATVNNKSNSPVEISIDGKEPSLVSKGRSVVLRPVDSQGNGKVKVYRGSKLIRECSFPYNMNPMSQMWEITDNGLTQFGMFSSPSYTWNFVDDD